MPFNHKPKVLFLPAWYPHKFDPMAGLFVYRHALAVMPFADVAVLQIVQSPNIKKHQIEEKKEDGIYVFRIYLKSVTIPVIGKMINGLNYRWSTRYAYEQIQKKWGKPDMCHVHILTRAGWLAMQLWKKFNIPYVISEHWSRYFPPNRESYKGNARKKYTELIVKHAKAVLPVSQILKNAMIEQGLVNANYQIIPNVVDMETFTLKPAHPASITTNFINVSCFDEKSKNLKGLVDAFQLLLNEKAEATLKLVGDGPDKKKLEEYVRQKGLSSKIVFTGELTGESLIQAYQLADVFVLSSHYETFAIVLTEAMACGLPIVSTPTGIAPELVNDETGKLAQTSSATDIKDAMAFVIQNKTAYNAEVIRKNVLNKFSTDTVGKSLLNIYTKVLSS